ncbi:MBL fold metallo-hydrolase [Sunxiuqinia elliptica]|uniref:L-ascorbate metabolism protein UlaG (Beta-lactamase superfamily) n=1 Tax=Sunxiuqinia elliptica TaxID=655355 RepID=A0A4R6GPW4_9BACT|nr:MBL fold metallo-hydrolase [Sunxiuqinia elliptica]TDN97107.1 L-ascorbate metabolism protein UlaG (beta-lactamase superfamily) [Sunxiuqinia elliptica]TDO60708.1 L-ascorbate metabolism protein UlaG (beta-lactamase superfamily) [Sunxiuqinia elliptica]
MTKSNSFLATYVGGPTVIIELAGLRIMTDPTLDPAGVYDLGHITLEKYKDPADVDVDKIDLVLLSHDQHQDNLDDAGRELLTRTPKVYTTVIGADRLGGGIIGLNPWETDRIQTPDGSELTITATPARHGPAGIEKITGEVIGFLLSVKGKQNLELYITGDTVYYEGVAEVAKRFNPSHVFIFAGAAQPKGAFHVTMSVNDGIDTAFKFPEAMIIPLHHDGWKHYTQTGDDLKHSFAAVGIDDRLSLLQIGVETEMQS